MKRWFLKNEVWVFLAPILCLGFAWLIRDTVLVDRLEWRTLDWRTQKRAELGASSARAAFRPGPFLQPVPRRYGVHRRQRQLAAGGINSVFKTAIPFPR